MVNEAVNRNLARHVDEYRVNIGASCAAERTELDIRAQRIAERKRATELEVMRLELDGMTAAEIQLAYSAASRLGAGMPLAYIDVLVDGELVNVAVWDE